MVFESLGQFATENRIISLIARERGKYASKDGGSQNDKLRNRVLAMTPPHKYWVNPGRGTLPQKADHGLAAWTYRKKSASIRVYRSILRYKKMLEAHPDREPVKWYSNLSNFVKQIQETLSSKGVLKLAPPTIIAKYKETDTASNTIVYRPICLYKDLDTKIIQALAYQYILHYFDRFFHKNMLFMRAPREIEENRYRTPQYLDAIDMVSDYRDKNKGRPIYVGECDIQKFYDIFNHDTIIECFEDLFEAAKKDKNLEIEDDSQFDSLRRVIKAFLDSYDFYSEVFAKNNDSEYWKDEIRRRTKVDSPSPKCIFKWVKEDDFLKCYTKEEFLEARDSKKLGIPQGGALSGIIVNVVMRVVDRPIVEERDSQRLFIRYCDDILLMHTDKEKCKSYLETYYSQLIKTRLVPHPRKDVSSFKSKTRETETLPGFWKAKSRNVYLWGPGGGDASDWVAFVGYEMRSTGEIRLRKDKIDGEYKKIARQFHKISGAKDVREALANHEKLSEERQMKLMERMARLPNHFKDYEKAGPNKYTFSQARRLDKYLYLKRFKAAKLIGCQNPASVAQSFETYSDVIDNKHDGQ